MLEEIQACTFASWSPKIGDPHIMGWVTVAAYALAALLALRAAMKAKHIYSDETVAMQRFFWIALAVLFLFLAVNKQLDLQSLFTAIGRCHAKINGWYDERRGFQRQFIYGMMGATACGFVILAVVFRKILRPNWLALLGVFLVMTFVAVRAVGFHHFDIIIGYEIGDVRMNWVMELGGIAFVIAGALFLPKRGHGNRQAVYIDWSKQEGESPGSGYSR